MTENDQTPTPPATPDASDTPAPEAPAPEAPAPVAETPAPEAETPAPEAPAPEAPVVETPAPAPAPTHSPGTPPDGHWWWGTGRRKSAVARVRIKPGDGTFIVNKKPVEKYFDEERDRNDLMYVLSSTRTTGKLEIHVNVNGGGYTGQAGAIKLGLGRALKDYDRSLEPILRDNGFLTRDARKVERKKYGQPGARKRFQFSKR